MFARLIVGIFKGLVVGGLIGFGLLKLGLGVFTPWSVLAFVFAAVTGIVIGLVAGKPIWAKDAKIEAGMKAAVGALLGAGLMAILQKWMPGTVPNDLATALGAAATDIPIKSFSVTSLAIVAALLGGFYDADNTPEADEKRAEVVENVSRKADAKKRIAASSDQEELGLEDEESQSASDKKAKK
ncbi:MAG: hypothetical protein IPM54_16535 [Polyangiaceae bacterium]|nr:hypothetical protein [Polyangiaceae bacterium]